MRSQSLATIPAIVCSYLLPGIRRPRSCLTLPQRLGPHGRQAPPPRSMSHATASRPEPRPCHASCSPPPGAANTHPRGPWCCWLRAIRATPPTAPQPASPPATPTAFEVLRTAACGVMLRITPPAPGRRRRRSRAWSVSGARAVLRALQGILPVKTLGDEVLGCCAAGSSPKLLTGAPPCIVLARHVGRVGVAALRPSIPAVLIVTRRCSERQRIDGGKAASSFSRWSGGVG